MLCSLIIGVMTWRLIRRETVMIGTLYALGYRKRELMRHYMAIPVLLAFVGGLLGSLLAVPCIAPTIRVIALSFIMPITDITQSFWRVLISILMPVTALGLSSYLVIRSVLKRPTAELMKGSKDKSKVGMLERFCAYVLWLHDCGFLYRDVQKQHREHILL
ncbi:MAG TPA: ABC transporter permease [Firmicutes bacterium]|nr:ABC transporter permease [Bacillota bacterium]